MARAASSLPVPLSPAINTGVRVSFSREIMRKTSWIFAELPMIPSRFSSVVTLSRKNSFSVTRRTFSAMRCRSSRIFSTRNGFAMKLGAYDYIEKPFRVEKMRLLLQRMAEKVRLVTENEFLRERVTTEENLDGIIGSSANIQDVLRMISRLKDTRTPVLISGESGTGKELAARAIHFRGAMAKTPFVAVDCGSLVPTLMESELFGYERGAFTGATKSKAGLFQAADGGTIFLDEIGELPLEMQAKLLRVLQEKEVRPVGSNEKVNVDV